MLYDLCVLYETHITHKTCVFKPCKNKQKKVSEGASERGRKKNKGILLLLGIIS